MTMLKIIAAFLMLMAVYNATFAAQFTSVQYALTAAGLAVTAGGLWFRKPWSQYLVYLISASLVAFSLIQVRALIVHGWPYPDLSKSVISLMIVCVPLMFGASIGIHVFRVFRT